MALTCPVLLPADPDGVGASDPGRVDATDPDGVGASDPGRVDATDPDGVGASDPGRVDATDPDGLGASAALEPGVARIYRNMSQNRQLTLGNSAQIFLMCQKVNKCKFYATSSLDC